MPGNFRVRASSAEKRAHVLLRRWMAVYRNQLKASLRIPLYNMFLDVTNYWGIEYVK